MEQLKFYNVTRDPGANEIGPKSANVQYFLAEDVEKIDTLVRETIQNPTDHPLDKNQAVKVCFTQRFIKTDHIPEKDQLIEVLDALIERLIKHEKKKGGIASKYLMHFKNARKQLTDKEINVLQISDYNTIGLIGKRRDQETNLGRFLGGTGWWDDASSGGGSGGLGKFAPFQVSLLNFCFYSSLNTLGEYIYYGWGNYFAHEIGKNLYSGEVNISDSNAEVVKSKTRITDLNFLSERDSIGTDVFSMGFEGGDSWAKEMIKAVIRNFYGAILDNKLVVEIKEHEKDLVRIDSTTITDKLSFFDSAQKVNRKNDLQPEGLTIESVLTYKDGKTFFSTNDDTPLLGRCWVKIKKDPDFNKHIAFMREPRMQIFSKRINSGDLPFSGIFATDNTEGNDRLRISEDSKHRKWVYDEIEPKKDGKAIKKEIFNFIEKCIREYCTHDSADEFEITGTKLISFGSKTKGAGSSNDDATKDDDVTATIYPKPLPEEDRVSFKNGGVFVFDKNGRVKKKNKEKRKNKGGKGGGGGGGGTKRRTRVTDLMGLIFKDNSSPNQYILHIETDVRKVVDEIIFQVSGAEDINFIEDVFDPSGNKLNRKAGVNCFENFILIPGANVFKVKTRFDKKVEIKIS